MQFWPLLLYLLPPAALAIGIHSLRRRIVLFSLANLAGTFVHEICHLVVGALCGARPVGFNLIPRRESNGKGYVMGSVSFTNVRWFNAAPTALAPLIALPVVVFVAWWRTQPGWRIEFVDGAIWILLAPQMLSCWPSSTDWRLALRSWPLFAAIAAGTWFVVKRQSE